MNESMTGGARLVVNCTRTNGSAVLVSVVDDEVGGPGYNSDSGRPTGRRGPNSSAALGCSSTNLALRAPSRES